METVNLVNTEVSEEENLDFKKQLTSLQSSFDGMRNTQKLRDRYYEQQKVWQNNLAWMSEQKRRNMVAAGNDFNFEMQDVDLSGLEYDDEGAAAGIYFAENNDGNYERIVYLDGSDKVSYDILDIDDDGQDEILYSVNDSVFIKDSNPEIAVDDEDDEWNIFEMEFEDFKTLFVPTESFENEVMTDGANFSFIPREGVNYYEWIVTERGETSFEIAKSPSQRVSETWDRNAVLFLPESQEYEVEKI